MSLGDTDVLDLVLRATGSEAVVKIKSLTSLMCNHSRVFKARAYEA